jgi:hypothetical protein
MKRIIAILLLLALITATLTVCAAKPHPPTEAEIAEFHRTHPVLTQTDADSAPHGSVVADPDQTDAEYYWTMAHNIIVEVEIVGEQFMENFKDHGITIPVYNYLAKVTDVMAYNHSKEIFGDIYSDTMVYLQYIGPYHLVQMTVGEKYLVVGRVLPEVTKNTYYSGVLERHNSIELPIIWSTFSSQYYITENSYIIDVYKREIEKDGGTSFTGKTLDETRALMLSYTSENGWDIDIGNSESSTASDDTTGASEPPDITESDNVSDNA